MRTRRNVIILSFVLLLAAAAAGAAQNPSRDVESEIAATLLKKELRAAIAEAENSPATDLESLRRRLSLYRRAANFEKVALTTRQIFAHRDFKADSSQARGGIEAALGSRFFDDPRLLGEYLQKIEFSEGLYEKFFRLCSANRAACDIEGFDAWLGQKDAAFARSDYRLPFENLIWTNRRIGWRREFGLDYREIENRFKEDLRKDPADFDAAIYYLAFFNTTADLDWLAENFSAAEPFAWHELGQRIAGLPNSLPPARSDEAPRIRRVAVRFLRKSLELPFGEKDARLMSVYVFSRVSMPSPKKVNVDKQLRFWTKEKLAELYRQIGEPQNAQPLVEELTTIDRSDIDEGSPTRLAGAVQAASGARVVEAEILRQQATRRNSYLYWQERVSYYEGRDEPALVFNSYMQAFAAVPFDLSDKRSAGGRVFFIRRFAEFVDDAFGQNANATETDDWSPEDKKRHRFWKDAESFLRGEFEKTKSNVEYAVELAGEIADQDFDELTNEILTKNSPLLIAAARRGLIRESADLLGRLRRNENIPEAKKDAVFGEFIELADGQSVKSAFALLEALADNDARKYFPKLTAVAERQFAKSTAFLKTDKPSADARVDYKNLPGRYAEILFGLYLAANNRGAAEKLMLDGYYPLHRGLQLLIESAARAGAVDAALRYWKIKANLDRQDLEDLTALKPYPALVAGLRDFYAQMKTAEPSSPVPDAALILLK